MFCSNCGQQLADDMRFCPNCGQAVNGEIAAVTVNADRADYSLLLIGRGTCAADTARDLISDLLGYTDAQAKELLRETPVEIACGLNAEQAMCLSQTLTEYGLQISIRNGAGYVDFSGSAAQSVFSENGSVLQNVMNVLSTLTLANQVKRAARWTLDDPLRFIFAPRYVRKPAPIYQRRFRRPPAPRRPAPPRRPAALRPILAPRPPRPALAPRPARPALAPKPKIGVRPIAAPKPTVGVRPIAAPKPTLGLRPAAPARPTVSRGPMGGLALRKGPNGPKRGPTGSGRGSGRP